MKEHRALWILISFLEVKCEMKHFQDEVGTECCRAEGQLSNDYVVPTAKQNDKTSEADNLSLGHQIRVLVYGTSFPHCFFSVFCYVFLTFYALSCFF